MSAVKSSASRACNKCIKGTSAFIKTQIALLRASGRSAEALQVVNRLKACLKLLNATSLPGKDAVRTTILTEDSGCHSEVSACGEAPVKALKPGAYVRNYFRWLSSKGVSLPAETIANGLDLKWSVRNLDLWRPLFATKESLTKADREGHRYWGEAFKFAGITLYVNSQWYGKARGRKQKAGFDRYAVELSRACGLSFSPYALPGVPDSESDYDGDGSSVEKCMKGADVREPISDGVTIRITSMKKRTFRFKG